MLTFNIVLTGPRDRVCAELTETPADAPESLIRGAIADHLLRSCNADDTVSVSVSMTIHSPGD